MRQHKGRLFHHILTLSNHLRCDFSISVKEMLEDDVNGLLKEISVVIAQGSDVLFVGRCDNFLLRVASIKGTSLKVCINYL